MFLSDLQGNVIVDDSNWQQHAKPLNADGSSSTGYIPRDYAAEPLGSDPGESTFPSELLIPRGEWAARIEEMEKTKTRLSDFLRASPVKWLNQSPTNYCWCYAVVQMVMAMRVRANLPYVRLSPFSVAAPIKNYQNVGGWGTQALSYIRQHGVASEEFWPQAAPGDRGGSKNMNAIRNGRQYFEGSRANAKLHVVTEWYGLRPRNFAEKMSCLLRRWPVASGYSWMGHERCTIDPLVLGRDSFGCMDLDSYSDSEGRFNTGVLNESKGASDDQVCARVTHASEK